MAEQDEQHTGEPTQGADQEWLQNYLSEHEGQVQAGTRISQPAQKKKGPERMMMLAGALVIALGAAGLLIHRNQSQASAKKDVPGDLGQAVVVASGLRAHLVTELDKNDVHYKLKIEPIALPEQDAFGRETASNTEMFYFNVRVLNPVGDAICGKQVVLTPVNNNTPPAGTDAVKRIKGDKGTIDGLWAEGTLPCSADQYARFGYWDFTTNFPTVDDQDRTFGIDHRAQTDGPQKAETHAQEDKNQRATAQRRAVAKKPQSGFFLQGDDHISAFEPGRNVLTVGPGRSFVVLRASDLSTAAAWADDAALVHYTCDTQAVCSLRRAGSGAVIVARKLN